MLDHVRVGIDALAKVLHDGQLATAIRLSTARVQTGVMVGWINPYPALRCLELAADQALQQLSRRITTGLTTGTRHGMLVVAHVVALVTEFFGAFFGAFFDASCDAFLVRANEAHQIDTAVHVRPMTRSKDDFSGRSI